ncbi:MAG: hypothetical protein FJX76_03570 [Armatimonadetes bacterium]|nr:hypothetical protein [Armatimonadota bacterium]
MHRKLLSLAALAIIFSGLCQATPASRTPQGWRSSYPEALRVAAQEKKPVLLLQMFGRLDEEFC